MEYIDNKIENGIKINWKKIRNRYKKLGVPNDYYNPCNEPIEQSHYHIILSERSSGKTTNLLLLGMLLNDEYGIIIQYIRSREEMIMPKNLNNLFSVINNKEFNYVEKITHGAYNSVVYQARRWYYCLRDSDGTIIEQANNHFMMCLSFDNNDNYKSSYTEPLGDFIIVDEFIERYYYPNSFFLCMDLIKTIIRSRLSPIIFFSANTIEKNSIWFDEFTIKKEIVNMKIGDKLLHETQQGTMINIHIYSPVATNQKVKSNKTFSGFANPKLASITGGDWAMNYVQHIPNNDYDIVSRNHYIKYSTSLLRLTLVKIDNIGLGVYVTKSTTLYDDSIVYTHDDVIDYRYRYGFGHTKLDKLIWNLYKMNRFYYSTNDVGNIVENYIKRIKTPL